MCTVFGRNVECERSGKVKAECVRNEMVKLKVKLGAYAKLRVAAVLIAVM